MAYLDKAMTTAESGGRSNVTEADLVACVPHLRIFAKSLTRNHDHAEDLVQDTIVRTLTAAHQFRAGTNLRAWMFTILRNLHCDQMRKKRVQTHSLDDAPGHEPAVSPSQEASLEFSDFRRAFWQLDDNRRKALFLVGADGLTYEEAAKLCDCPKGTVKSRVSRARRELLRILEDASPVDERPDAPALAGYVGGAPAMGRAKSAAASAW
jgi:RNA polymerase sigma-70 factor (ECF subfamily)